MVQFLAVVGVILLALVSIVVGAMLGAIVGAIYVPIKVVSLVMGEDGPSATNESNDLI